VFALFLQMGNVLQGKLQDHWSRFEQFYIPFHENTTTQILADTKIFAFSGQMQKPDRKKE
jgi:transcriptional antiterminator Rof (Rho-off)